MFLVNAQDIVVASFAGSIKPLGKFDSSTHNVNNNNFHKILHGNSIHYINYKYTIGVTNIEPTFWKFEYINEYGLPSRTPKFEYINE